MRVLFTCGGTGGHINPAISVANLIRAKHPRAQILFAGARGGMETTLVPREGYELRTVEVSSFERSLLPKSIAHNVKTALTMHRAKHQASEILDSFRPDIVLGTGGYASYPIIERAASRRIPTAIHESNFAPGLTTRMLAPKVDRIMVNFEECKTGYSDSSKVIVTGTPVREGFLFTKKADARERLHMGKEPLVVSYWGSLGAREMNKRIADFMLCEARDPSFRHIHATGSFGWRWMPEYVKKLGVDLADSPLIDMCEYIYDMPVVMNAANLIICRGGASTIGELCAAAIPAIIVPSPNVAENHQEKNARALERLGAAIVITEKECTGEGLHSMVKELLSDGAKLGSMSAALGSLAILDAAERIYNIILDLIA